MNQRAVFSRERPAKILIVDDHPLVRAGLELQISSHEDLQTCGNADGMDEALEIQAQLRPDLIIVDLTLKTGDGLDLIREARRLDPDVKMLVLSAHEESLYAERALGAGASGYVNKQEAPRLIVEAIRHVLSGKRYVSSRTLERITVRALEGETIGASPTDTLSDRELEVFQLIGDGQSTAGIANKLHLSPHTVDSHREHIRYKLGLDNASQLMRRAILFQLESE